MNVICVYNKPWRGGNLNLRQLLNPLFFSRDINHLDSTRQRKARQRARDLKAARALKAAAVPLRKVDPTIYLRRFDGEGWSVIELTNVYGSAYRRKVRSTYEEVRS